MLQSDHFTFIKSGKMMYKPHLPAKTTMLLVHQSRDLVSLNHWVANTVWAAALAVPDNRMKDDNMTMYGVQYYSPDMLCVRGEVTLICRPVT